MSESAYASPDACRLGKKVISEFAEDVARSAGFEVGADLEPLVRQLGGHIEYQDFWDLQSSESGSIVINGKGDFAITLAAHTSPARDRFTIAHELGHYFLHFRLPLAQGKDVGKMRAARYGGDQAEVEANWFAASFLMPAADFTRAYQEANGDHHLLAGKFGVSVQASTVRAKSLGLG